MNDQTIDIGRRVQQYVALRDKISAIEKQQKETLAPYKETLDRLGNVLLQHLEATNQEMARTNYGTVTRSIEASASLADADLFMRHVIATESWELLDRRANKTAVTDFIEENGSPPPGVNYSTRAKVGVRRPTGK